MRGLVALGGDRPAIVLQIVQLVVTGEPLGFFKGPLFCRGATQTKLAASKGPRFPAGGEIDIEPLGVPDRSADAQGCGNR